MKRFFRTIAVFLSLSAVAFAAEPPEVYFSPRGGCTEAVVKEISRAKESILVQAYSFTSAPIAEALAVAKKRGVDVQVVVDQSQETAKRSVLPVLAKAGISTKIDDKHAIAHNKIIVVDDKVVLTGSFNFTAAAEFSNAENLVILRDRETAEKYAANWKSHAEHSDKPAKGKP